MFLFDLTTTAINNYIDTRQTGNRCSSVEKRHWLSFMSSLLSTATGLYLAHITDIVVLIPVYALLQAYYTAAWTGLFSRQPLGEILSGVFYGFFHTVFDAVHKHAAGNILRLNAGWNMTSLDIMVWLYG